MSSGTCSTVGVVVAVMGNSIRGLAAFYLRARFSAAVCLHGARATIVQLQTKCCNMAPDQVALGLGATVEGGVSDRRAPRPSASARRASGPKRASVRLQGRPISE